MLNGKRILITGVLTRQSLAFTVARRAQEEGADILLTSFGRIRRMTERAARNLPEPVDILELDVTKTEDFLGLRVALEERWGTVDGGLHSVAFAPPDAINGRFLHTPPGSAKTAFEVSAYSFKGLAETLQPLMPAGGSLVGLDFDASTAWPRYDWMGVSKAALEAVSRYLARDLGRQGIRVNLVSSGPIKTVAAGGIGDDFAHFCTEWQERAPLGWVPDDPSPVADAILFLFSDASRGVSGEILHVDGGFHAMAGGRQSELEPLPDTVALA